MTLRQRVLADTKIISERKRILIADDSASSRDLLRAILEASQYEVSEAEDGEQALEKAIPFNPHLVILDLQMPKLNGYSTVSALRRMPPFECIPIVALTAAITLTAPEQISDAGFTTYLVKPVAPRQLRTCVAGLLSAAD